MSELHQAARAYAERYGWHVFPVLGATPAVPWRAESTTDPATIDAWWSRWPSANIGIDCGKSGLTVVDVDPGGRWADPTRHTLTAHTGREGGRHHYFVGGGVPNSAGRLADSVDVRGDGGFVFAPPSVSAKTGRTYRWANAIPPAPLPDHVRLAAMPPERPEREPGAAPAEANDRWGQRILEGEVARIALARKGKRNDTLFAAAANVFEAVKGGHIDHDVAVDQLQLAAERAGLDPLEVEKSLASAWETVGERHPLETAQPTPTFVEPPPPGAANDDEGFELLDVAGLRTIPPPRYLIDGRLPEGLTAIVGQPKSGKTFVALDWALTVAALVGPVVYWTGEGVKGLAQRILAWQAERPHADLSRLRVVRKMPRLLDPNDLRAFYATIRQVMPTLTVVDTLSRATPGVNENDSENFTRIVASLDAIRDTYETSSLVVHHTNKGGLSPRGSNSLDGAVDAMWRAERDAEHPDSFTLSNVFMKDDDEKDPLLFQIRARHNSALVFPSELERARHGGAR